VIESLMSHSELIRNTKGSSMGTTQHPLNIGQGWDLNCLVLFPFEMKFFKTPYMGGG